jgi:hypothetical protein
MAMTKEEDELGGIEFPADAECGLSPLDREDYLNWAFQSLETPAIAKLLVEYDRELVARILGGASERTAVRLRQLLACDDLGPSGGGVRNLSESGGDENFTWFDWQMYLDYAFQRLSCAEKLRLLRHCEPDLLNYIRSPSGEGARRLDFVREPESPEYMRFAIRALSAELAKPAPSVPMIKVLIDALMRGYLEMEGSYGERVVLSASTQYPVQPPPEEGC